MDLARTADPGPLARLDEVKADTAAPSVIFQRLCERETLAQIAKAWGLPKGRFFEWFTTEHAPLYDAALKVLAGELAFESLDIADEQAEVVKKDGSKFDPEVPRDKLRVDTRLRLASHLDRARYGAAKDAAGGGITVVVDRSCGGAVTVGVKDAGGNQAAVRIGSAEASALPGAISQEI